MICIFQCHLGSTVGLMNQLKEVSICEGYDDKDDEQEDY